MGTQLNTADNNRSATPTPIDVVQRSIFQIVIYDRDFPPTIVLDVSLLPADIQALLKQAKETLQDAEDVIVDSEPMYEYAARLRRQARDDFRALDEFRKSIITRIDAIWESVMVVFRGEKSSQNGPLPWLDQGRLLLDEKIITWQDAETRRRDLLQKQVNDEIAQKRQEKLEEADEVQLEAQAVLVGLSETARQAEQHHDDETLSNVLHEAREVSDNAQRRTTALVNEAALLFPSPIALAPIRKAAGFTRTEKKEVEVYDLRAFFKGIADGQIPMIMGLPNQKLLDKHAAPLGDELNYPGCRVITKKRGASR
ncbi:MAG: hypothetical protein V7638_3904 [Acidobacteriota bacterium]|jgi:hypothetical protein